MKTSIYLPLVLMCIAAIGVLTSFGQKYKVAADTVKLNKEYADVTKNIAEQTVKLTEAQNLLPVYQAKATSEASQAQAAAEESSHEASKATNGNMSDIKRAKKRASTAVNQAEDARDAQNKVKDQNKKIEKLNKDLQKNQKRLQDLDAMRSSIMNASVQ